MLLDHLPDLGLLIRRQAEVMARSFGVSSKLNHWCAVVSCATVTVAKIFGADARLAAGGIFFRRKGDVGMHREPHFWALVGAAHATVPEQWADYATIVDMTATQFPIAWAAEVLILGPDDYRRRDYELEELGAEAERHVTAGDRLIANRLLRASLPIVHARFRQV
jgi:hypothetical protein